MHFNTKIIIIQSDKMAFIRYRYITDKTTTSMTAELLQA